MKKAGLFTALFFLTLGVVQQAFAQLASPQTYLLEIKTELVKQWPKNRTVNLVFHGHSVPSGYFKTPVVSTLEAYPFLVLEGLKKHYPHAVINAITTAIGGENSEQGQKRFKRQVLTHQPDVLFIDYALNDRAIGLERSRRAMEKMIRMALKKNIKVILLTPSPDMRVNLLEANNVLEQHASLLHAIAEKYQIGLADSYSLFKELAAGGKDLENYMSQVNHPDKEGHALIATGILRYFKD
jgi:acyl-CoA thioesterase I